MKQPPSQLLADNDGHWYLVPESEVVSFESALNLLVDDPDDDAFLSFEGYRIDNPSNLRILAWEEMK